METPLEYSAHLERLFAQEAEQAESMAMMHTIASRKYTRLSTCLNVPVILASSAIGFLSAVNLFEHQELALGAASIGVAALKTLDSYFDITKRAEGHRQTALAYKRISKSLQLQLALPRPHRAHPQTLLQVVTNDMASLRNQEPSLDESVVSAFKKRYGHSPTHKDPIANGLTVVKVYSPQEEEAQLPPAPPEGAIPRPE